MKKIIALVISFAPLAALAQSQIGNIDDVASTASSIGDTLIVLLISFSVIWIIISVVRYLIAGGEDDRKKGGMAILWGVVGLFVILSIWGLVAILRNSFDTQDQVPTGSIPKTLVPPSI